MFLMQSQVDIVGIPFSNSPKAPVVRKFGEERAGDRAMLEVCPADKEEGHEEEESVEEELEEGRSELVEEGEVVFEKGYDGHCVGLLRGCSGRGKGERRKYT